MTTFKVRVKKYDLTLLVVLMLLILAGLVILYSTSVYNGEVKFHDAMYYLKKQLFATALGLAVSGICAAAVQRSSRPAAFELFFVPAEHSAFFCFFMRD